MPSVVDRNVVMRRMTIVLHSVLCSRNVFDVHAQMLREVNDTEFFVLLRLYISSQYINSSAVRDCIERVTV